MDITTKNKIRKEIRDRKLFAFNGYRVRILGITEDHKVQVLKLKANREAFRKITVPYSELEEIIDNPYSHKNPKAFLQRNGFKLVGSDEGRPLMEKQVDGVKIIIGHSDPATKKNKDISIMAESSPRSGILGQVLNTTNFHEALNRIPEFVRMAKGRKTVSK